MKVAVTGGLASGKSSVMAILERLGAKTLYADRINAELLENPNYIEKLAKIFPNVIKNSSVDKKALAESVFSDEKKLEKLNALAHPYILERIKNEQGDVFVEMPLMNGRLSGLFDRIWAVEACEKLRIERAARRDGRSRKQIEGIIAAQQKCDYRADESIANDGDFLRLYERVETLYKEINR